MEHNSKLNNNIHGTQFKPKVSTKSQSRQNGSYRAHNFGYFDANLRTVWRTRYRPKNAVANMFLFYIHFSNISSTEN